MLSQALGPDVCLAHTHGPPLRACWHVADVPGVQGRLEVWKLGGLEAWLSLYKSLGRPVGTSIGRAGGAGAVGSLEV